MTTTVPAVWKVGDVILDQYEVTEKLGQGGMGIVHKVHHKRWNVDLAVKSLLPEKANNMELFIHEAETWVNLPLHPNIVSCYYVRSLAGIPRIFAECVAGGSLHDWMRNHRLYEGGREQVLERILDVAIQFAWGLHAAHLQGLVHQDVKPSNVMMTLDGNAKVTDFGLAKARMLSGGGVGQSILVSYEGMTQAYCSPEQAARQPMSRKTDIWSWGVSVLQMFVGPKEEEGKKPKITIPWALGPQAGIWLQSNWPAVAQDEDVPEMPDEVKKLLFHCFQPQPNNRPATMLEIAEVLQKIYADKVGRPYPREIPQPARMLADSLNNRALSLLDLGKIGEAKQEWERALQADPHHLYTIYNRGIVLWRQEELTDVQLAQHMGEVQVAQKRSWQAMYLLAQVYLELGDITNALSLLQKAVELAPHEVEVRDLLGRIQSGGISVGRYLRTFNEPFSHITSISLSADRRLALAGSTDGSMQLWEIATGRCLRIFQGHTARVTSVSLSADGKVALSGSFDQTVRLWEATTGHSLSACSVPKEQRREDPLLRHLRREGRVSVSLSADGRLALFGREDNSNVYLWNIATVSREDSAHTTVDGRLVLPGLGHTINARQLRVFQGHTAGITSVSLSADGHLAVSASADKTVRLWEVATGRSLCIFQGHADEVTSVSLSTDGKFILSGCRGLISGDNTVRLWEVATGHCLRILKGHTDSILSVSLSADGHLGVSGSADGTMRVWEMTSGHCLRIFQGNKGRVSAVGLSADGCWTLFGGDDETIKMWEMPREHFSCPLLLSQVWSQSDSRQIETQATTLLQRAEHAIEEKRFTLALDLVRQARALPGWERSPKSMEIWERLSLYCLKVGLRTGWVVRTFKDNSSGVSSVNLSADGSLAASGGDDGTIRLWEVATGRCLHILQGHREGVIAVSLSADGRLALSSLVFSSRWDTLREDNTVRLWEVATGRCLHILHGHSDTVLAVSLSADGRLALSGSRDKTVRVWETATGHCLSILQGHAHWVSSVSLSADGRLAASGGPDDTVRVWEVNIGSKRARVLVTAVCNKFCLLSAFLRRKQLTADYKIAVLLQRLLSASVFVTKVLTRLATGRCLSILQGHTKEVTSVSLSADGRLALSGSRDKTVRVWETATGRCLSILQGHTDVVLTVSLSADGRWAASGSHDKTVRVWEVATGNCLRVFQRHTEGVTSVSLSADGWLVLSGGRDKIMQVWELDWELEALPQR
ncbi:MAG TPA: protein kinase [Ktedonosporobacter sp.]|nr:protein kinase [Ktedonosporobacter sp.]